MNEIAPSARTYLVPQNGTIEPASVADRDELRKVRTELEILHRVARITASARLVPPKPGDDDAEVRRELFAALKDACDPLVEKAITLIDGDDPQLRKEIFMSVVNEEAQNIVQEAIDCGVALPPPDPAPPAGTRAAVATRTKRATEKPGPSESRCADQVRARAESRLADALRSPHDSRPSEINHEQTCDNDAATVAALQPATQDDSDPPAKAFADPTDRSTPPEADPTNDPTVSAEALLDAYLGAHAGHVG